MCKRKFGKFFGDGLGLAICLGKIVRGEKKMKWSRWTRDLGSTRL